jgi:type II secretory ATPase GspE/PulE/Tfp pilus assembly ATPase PilB-like protein
VAHEIFCLWGVDAEFFPVDAVIFGEKWKNFCEQMPVEEDASRISEILCGQGGGESSAITGLLDRLLFRAVRDGASDVHFESLRGIVAVRFRLDGNLRTVARIPAELEAPLFLRLRALARLDVSERFRPQDGRFGMKFPGGFVDFRISTLPTKFGESIVLRILDRRRLFLCLGDLSMPNSIADAVRSAVEAPSGLFLVVGPTGSGKTTTLYAALRELHRPNLKILTVEDPVEYEMEGCLQAPVDLAVGRTFSSVLRAFLRHDPDKIFVGEIRDGETAQVALRAALTGHLVLSTLHAATPGESLLRLEKMGVESSLLTLCLRGILSQRLLRLNCPKCSAPDETAQIPPSLSRHVSRGRLRRGIGCPSCCGTGQVGRRAVFEFFPADSREGFVLRDPERPAKLVAEGLALLEAGLVSAGEFLKQLPWNR